LRLRQRQCRRCAAASGEAGDTGIAAAPPRRRHRHRSVAPHGHRRVTRRTPAHTLFARRCGVRHLARACQLRYWTGMALVFEQLFDPESWTYSYLLGDDETGVAALIDPVVEQVDRDLARVAAHGLRLVYTLETHMHADHVTGAAELTARTGS